MQLVAYGAQDVYLTSNPQITFWKVTYRRYTNFAMESIEQTFNGQADFGRRVTCTVSRNGDLAYRTYLQVVLPEINQQMAKHARWLDFPGEQLISQVEVEIGGQRIDKIYGRFTHLWHKLSCKAEKEVGYELMTGNDGPDGESGEGYETERKLYIPINFWFSKGSAGAALPLIALQYHEVRITIELADKKDILRNKAADVESSELGTSSESETTAKYAADTDHDIDGMAAQPRLYSDFFYLDTDERRRFSQMSHEYLIEQLQFTGSEMTSNINLNPVPFTMRLNMNHPTKAIYWTTEVSSDNDAATNPFYNGWRKDEPTDLAISAAQKDYGRYHDNCPIERVQLQLNGHERFSARDGTYFWLCQPYQHHTRVPYDHWVGMYSFCLSPEEHQPSGALNFSRIDNATLKIDFKKAHDDRTSASNDQNHARTVYVYAVSYNVLRILSGMGGLAFSS